MAELIFYTNPMSRGQIARWMLEEVGAPYEQRLVDYGEAMKGPEYGAVNPMGKVPAIVHDGQTVTECAAICAYLAEAFPDAGLAPSAAERAAYYRWLFFAAGPLEQAVVNRSMGWEAPADKQRMVGYGQFELVVGVLAGWLESRDYVCGERFTAADVYVGAQVDWGLAFGSLPTNPAFEAYAARLRERPAYSRAKAIDNALIAAAQAASADARPTAGRAGIGPAPCSPDVTPRPGRAALSGLPLRAPTRATKTVEAKPAAILYRPAPRTRRWTARHWLRWPKPVRLAAKPLNPACRPARPGPSREHDDLFQSSARPGHRARRARL